MKKICLTIFTLALVGCVSSPEITAWNMARDVNTSAGYQNFISRYPKSGHVDEARELVGKSKMEQIMRMETVSECVLVMKTNPDSKTAAMVSELAYKAALKETSVLALYDFLVCFKGHRGVLAVRNRLEEIEFKNAKAEETPESMEFFLLKYPQSRFAVEGQDILSEKSYKQSMAWNNQFGFKAFVLKFPESSHAAAVRKLIKVGNPQHKTQDAPKMLQQVAEKSPWLNKYGCALTISSGIQKNRGDVDVLRRALYNIEKGAASGELSEFCLSVTYSARSDASVGLDEALRAVLKADELRKMLANQWKVYGQSDEIAKTAVVASTKVADELEAAELSEEVLGNGSLGVLDAGKEKGSVSARKALERFKSAEASVAKDRDEIKRLLLDANAQYKPLQRYITNCLDIK